MNVDITSYIQIYTNIMVVGLILQNLLYKHPALAPQVLTGWTWSLKLSLEPTTKMFFTCHPKMDYQKTL
jgi:hypothetical protein